MDAVLNKAKALVAAIGTVFTLGSAALADNAVSLDEVQGVITAVLAVATILGVYAVPNKPTEPGV